MNGYELYVEFRDVEEWEQHDSCNGCHEQPIVRIFEVGNRGPLGGSGSAFRLCRDCLAKLKTMVTLA